MGYYTSHLLIAQARWVNIQNPYRPNPTRVSMGINYTGTSVGTSLSLGLRGSKGTKDHVKRDGKLAKHPPVRKLEFSLEDQIFRILKRARIVTGGPNSLFHLPTR